MKKTNEIISEFIAYYNLDDPEYIPHLLHDPCRIREVVGENFSESDPVGKLDYEDLKLLSKEHAEFLEQHKNHFHNIYDVEVCLANLLADIAFNEVVNRLSEDDILVSLLKEELKVAA